MEEKEIKKLILTGAEELGLSLTEEATKGFSLYLSELIKWGSQINLTSIRDAEETIKRHFLDSLTLLPFLEIKTTKPKRILDIGTGAGLPGIPIKLASPSIELVLLETSGKKANFLRHIIRVLDLKQVQVIKSRAEDPKTTAEFGAFFDIVTSRALTALPEFVVLARPYLAKGGKIIAMKGPINERLEEELEAIKTTTKLAYKLHTIKPPFGQSATTIVIFDIFQ
ncbi:MAG: 16S rRNA (guanine(527)-N(7))-methyltransferase RsmG [Deltaproteobacteria bacterium]|nr:16S rRNA (guanine(527)-N(7))-methyltransferase RsmG [Deltaproteobacteria bacterium]